MKQWLMNSFFRIKKQAREFLQEEKGDTNIISIILIIIVVIALVAIFRTQLTEIVNGLFEKIKEALGL